MREFHSYHVLMGTVAGMLMIIGLYEHDIFAGILGIGMYIGTLFEGVRRV